MALTKQSREVLHELAKRSGIFQMIKDFLEIPNVCGQDTRTPAEEEEQEEDQAELLEAEPVQ